MRARAWWLGTVLNSSLRLQRRLLTTSSSQPTTTARPPRPSALCAPRPKTSLSVTLVSLSTMAIKPIAGVCAALAPPSATVRSRLTTDVQMLKRRVVLDLSVAMGVSFRPWEPVLSSRANSLCQVLD